MGSWGPHSEDVFHWFPRCISVELDLKWSSWDSNRCSYGMPALQATYPTVPHMPALEDNFKKNSNIVIKYVKGESLNEVFR